MDMEIVKTYIRIKLTLILNLLVFASGKKFILCIFVAIIDENGLLGKVCITNYLMNNNVLIKDKLCVLWRGIPNSMMVYKAVFL